MFIRDRVGAVGAVLSGECDDETPTGSRGSAQCGLVDGEGDVTRDEVRRAGDGSHIAVGGIDETLVAEPLDFDEPVPGCTRGEAVVHAGVGGRGRGGGGWVMN